MSGGSHTPRVIRLGILITYHNFNLSVGFVLEDTHIDSSASGCKIESTKPTREYLMASLDNLKFASVPHNIQSDAEINLNWHTWALCPINLAWKLFVPWNWTRSFRGFSHWREGLFIREEAHFELFRASLDFCLFSSEQKHITFDVNHWSIHSLPSFTPGVYH